MWLHRDCWEGHTGRGGGTQGSEVGTSSCVGDGGVRGRSRGPCHPASVDAGQRSGLLSLSSATCSFSELCSGLQGPAGRVESDVR